MPEAVRPVDVIRVHGTVRTEDADRAAVEEPLDLARDAVLTLVGFVRGSAFNVDAHPERIS